MLKLYRKGSKSEICFSDKDFIQVATILYDRKYQNTQKTAFNEWCRSLFKAMNLEEPKDIKKAKKNDFETKVLKAMSFLGPEICRFYGIIIKMFFKPKEHEPAHIHAIYNEYVGIFDIHSFEMIRNS